MRKLIKSILPEVGIEDLKIRLRGDNHCESANCLAHKKSTFPPPSPHIHLHQLNNKKNRKSTKGSTYYNIASART